jgi:hypothetical protein
MYLKSKYRKIPFPDIAFIFEKNKYSLTLTCDELDVWTSSQKRTARKFGLGCGCPKPHELSMAFVHEVSIHELQCCEFLRITVYSRLGFSRILHMMCRSKCSYHIPAEKCIYAYLRCTREILYLLLPLVIF